MTVLGVYVQALRCQGWRVRGVLPEEGQDREGPGGAAVHWCWLSAGGWSIGEGWGPRGSRRGRTARSKDFIGWGFPGGGEGSP